MAFRNEQLVQKLPVDDAEAKNLIADLEKQAGRHVGEDAVRGLAPKQRGTAG